jgi:phosphoglycerate dehydrogenase-like enzyme
MTGAGVDTLLPAPDLPEKVRIANARGIHGVHMGEFALAMMLAFEKRIPTWLEQQQTRDWRRRGIHTLRGKTVAILGLGAIGTEIVRLCGAFGMRVVGTRRGAQPVAGVDRVGGPEDTAVLLADADYVVVLLPLTPETRAFLGAKLLDALPERAVLINLARGGIVDEPALIARLRDGRLRGAALDVFDREPLPDDDPIWKAPNTILTPHIAGWFPGYAEKLAEIFSENLGRLERGETLRNEVDRTRGY